MDLTGYDRYFADQLVDYPLPEEDLQNSLKSIENLPKPDAAKTGKW
jgi:hypothetical protein